MHKFVNQRANTASLGLSTSDDGIHLLAIAERDFAAGRVGRELMSQVLQQRPRIGGNQRLKFDNVAKSTLVREHAVRIDLRSQLKTDADRRIDASALGGQALADRPVPRAKTADDVERFQRKARRVDLRMTRSSNRFRAVLGKLLANGRGAANVGLDGRDARRRRFRWLAQKSIHDERPARHW